MKKVLLYNRRIIKLVMVRVFPITCAFTCILGASILIGKMPSLDLSKYPMWIGYLLLYGGFIILLGWTIDMFVLPLFSLFNKKNKPQTLKGRVREAEGK